MTASRKDLCRHCGGLIFFSRNAGDHWIHQPSGSIYCDQSAITRAVPTLKVRL